MELKKRLGSEKYPLRLTDHGGLHAKDQQVSDGDSSDFEEIRKKICPEFINFPHESSEYINFYKLRGDLSNKFLTNVISNPHLSSLEIKLALYFERLSHTECEGFVCLLDKELCRNSIDTFIGEDGFLYYGFPNETQPMFILNASVHLEDVIQQLNLTYDPDEARQAILNLHNFSYITVTEIRWENVQKRALRNLKTLPDDKRVYGLIVKLYPMMETKDLSKYWKSLG